MQLMKETLMEISRKRLYGQMNLRATLLLRELIFLRLCLRLTGSWN